MEVLSEHLCEGWLEGYLLTGQHGLYATYEAFAIVSASMPCSTPNGCRTRRGDHHHTIPDVRSELDEPIPPRSEAIRRVPRLSDRAAGLMADCKARIEQSMAYAREHLEGPPEIRDWVWSD
jgi:phosphoketolase